MGRTIAKANPPESRYFRRIFHGFILRFCQPIWDLHDCSDPFKEATAPLASHHPCVAPLELPHAFVPSEAPSHAGPEYKTRIRTK